MIERQIEINTQDGRMNTFICHPERYGPHQVILFFMDAPGIREELRDMVRRLAAVGYYVMLPNLYYRSGVEELGPFIGEAFTATRSQLMQLKDTLNVPMVMADADALIAFAGEDTAARYPMGCLGYCMSGRYAVNTAVRHPDKVRAAASIYGTALVTEDPHSPHRSIKRSDARLYFACAETDSYMPQEMVEELRSALARTGGNIEVEVYPGTLHGFAFPQRPVYDKPSAERHWERLFALFGGAL